MLKYINIKLINNILYVLLIIILTHLSNFYYNLYLIYVRGYEERMIRSYGDCEKESYGFVKKSYQLTKSQNLEIINFEDQLWPNISGLFNIVNKPVDKNYIVLLNLKNLDKKIDKDNFLTTKNIKLNLKNKNIILKDSNCYLIKND
jgi:hypothetical protein